MHTNHTAGIYGTELVVGLYYYKMVYKPKSGDCVLELYVIMQEYTCIHTKKLTST